MRSHLAAGFLAVRRATKLGALGPFHFLEAIGSLRAVITLIQWLRLHFHRGKATVHGRPVPGACRESATRHAGCAQGIRSTFDSTNGRFGPEKKNVVIGGSAI